MSFYFIFFVKQKTAYEMRISYWSAYVCSSDLDRRALLLPARELGRVVLQARAQAHHPQRILAPQLAFVRRHAAVTQRHVAVVAQVQVRDQLEALEDEADHLVARLAALVVRQALAVFGVTRELAAGERLQQPGPFGSGGLAGP